LDAPRRTDRKANCEKWGLPTLSEGARESQGITYHAA
jgi:hypothetical protein